MTITINGQPADIVLEDEKNVGDVLSGLDHWLAGSGHRLSGLEIDGEPADSLSLERFFNRELDRIRTLDIKTSSLPELTAEALLYTWEDGGEYENAGAGEKQAVAARWRNSPAALFLAAHVPEIYEWAEKTFSGEGAAPGELRGLIDERLRELGDPAGELNNTEPLIEATASRLEELPLDIQTGKDGRAAETIRIFSHVSEKVFRLLHILKTRGLDTSALKVDDVSAAEYIEDFGAALRELTGAYETKDAVLVGDLAEYELAPRFRKLYALIKNSAAPPVWEGK
jgi:hypothetical protein